MILSLIGPDSYRRTQRLRILRRGFMQKYDGQGFNVEEFTGKELTVDDFRRVATSGGLFASKRLVVWEDPFAALIEVREGVAEVMGKLTDDAVVILVMDELPKKGDALTEVINANKQEKFPSLDPQERLAWITQTTKQAGVQMEFAAARYLAEACADDLWLASNEIQKLASQTNNITLTLVKEDLPDPTNDSIFAFTDAFTARQEARTLKLMHEQLANGASPFQLMAMVSKQLSTLSQLQETGGEGTQLHAFVIKKNLAFAQKLEKEKLQSAKERLLADEFKIKTGQVDPVTALDLFVIDWCQRGA